MQSSVQNPTDEAPKTEGHTSLAQTFPANSTEMPEVSWDSNPSLAMQDIFRNSENPLGSLPYKKVQKAPVRSDQKSADDNLSHSQPYY